MSSPVDQRMTVKDRFDEPCVASDSVVYGVERRHLTDKFDEPSIAFDKGYS